MRKLVAVIRREFVERVRSRAFLIGTVLGPLLMAFIFVFPIVLERRGISQRTVVVIDGASGQLGERVTSALRAAQRGSGSDVEARYLVTRVAAMGRVDFVRDSLLGQTGRSTGGIDGLLLLTDEDLSTGRITYLGANVGSPNDMATLQAVIRPAVLAERLERAGIDPGVVLEAVGPVELATLRVSEGKLTTESGEASFALAYAMAFLLYIALVLYGVQVMSSIVEEKSNRIIEVLASSLTPFQLMLGKVVGVGAVGLFQLTIWAGTATLLTTYRAEIGRLIGATPEAVAALPIPSISLSLLAVFLTFFLLGYFFYAGAYAAVGAMCSSNQETQQANTPVTLCVMVGFILTFSLLKDPNGSLAHTLSLIPPMAPFATPLRYSISPLPTGELAMSAGATLLGVFAITWLASRIYRVGILAYGKRPTFRELARWVGTG